MIRKLSLLLLLVPGMLLAQEKPKDIPKMPDAARVKILQAQLAEERATRTFEALQAQANKVRTDYQQAEKELADAQAEAYKLAGVDKKDWLIEMEKVEFVPAPKPAPAPKPEAKKPADAPKDKP